MDNDEKQRKWEQSLKRISEAYNLATKKNIKKFGLEDIIENANSLEEAKFFEANSFYGFNVRLQKSDSIIPLIGGEIWKNRKDSLSNVIERIDNLTIPEIFSKTTKREVEFALNKDNKVVEERKNFSDDDVINNSIITLLEEKDSFAVVQKKTLFQESTEDVYFWISRECEDIENNNNSIQDGSLKENYFLSNILIISKQKECIKFAKKHHLDFLRFLFKMETAYASILERERETEAIKSAKAAIMSRNMSHNLGSHVMFYIKQKLQSVEKIVNTGTLRDLVKADSLSELKNITFCNEDEMPFLVGLGRFINYLQERQDYIATIATDYIPYKSSINFKDAIYDELKPELRFLRHKTENDSSMKGKQAANLLLQYIAYSEGFKESEKIKLLFGDNFDGTGKPSDVPPQLRLFNVALPGGNLGRQAFFSIMENILRNSAKHDGAKMPNVKELAFRFDLIDAEEISDLYAWTNEKVYDSKDSVYKTYGKHNNDFHYLGITVDIDNKVDNIVLDKIKNGLDKRYLNDDGRMNEDCKGIKEIRISAAWMRGYGIDTVIPNTEPPAVAIRNNSNRLQYIICLPKPKRIAVVREKKSVLDENGIQYFSSNELNHETKRNIADFEMVVCSEADKKELISVVGSRILTLKEGDKLFKENENYDEFYMKWLQVTFGENLPKLIVNDGKSYENKNIQKININDSSNDETDMLLDKELFKKDKELVICNSDESSSDQIVYAKHYEGQEGLRETYKNAIFLEGVSGGNSTDRLIRQEKWTKEWYVKHMTAGLTKIAIFDERIHDSFSKKGINPEFKDLTADKLRQWIEELIENNTELCQDGKIQYPFFKISVEEKYKNLVEAEEFLVPGSNELFVQVIDDNKTLNSIVTKLRNSNTKTDYTVALLYSQKGIEAFDILSQNSKVSIIGYSPEKDEDIEVATLSKDENGVACMINDAYKHKFNFITIHQSILEKICETLGDKDDLDLKKKVTTVLFDKFSSRYEDKTDDGFLPQFIIHSGRSRPAKKDMPQHQPFIQFAALDHAVRDCKYTVTELLYSAHYEE